MKVALVACVKEKRNQPCPAKEMYVGDLFGQFLACADAEGAETWFILSGKHHLLHPDEVISPYDFNLNHASETYRRAWAATVVQQLDRVSDLHNDHFVLIANPIYLEFIIPHLRSYSIPMEVD